MLGRIYKLLIIILMPAAVLDINVCYSQSDKATRPRIVITDSTRDSRDIEKTQSDPSEASSSRPQVIIRDIRNEKIPSSQSDPSSSPTKIVPVQSEKSNFTISNEQSSKWDLLTIKSKIAEAKRLLQSKPLLTSLLDSSKVDTSVVRLAYYDKKRNRIDYVTISKSLFLKGGAEFPASSSDGNMVIIRVIRGNGVNTPVTIWEDGEFHVPLVVQYPIERGGFHRETAYYVSTHPGLVTPEIVQIGKIYVRNLVDAARSSLKEKGIFVSKELANIAERLIVVEHVDHYRFRNEYHLNIFNDIYALCALNEGQTYAYAISSAGAGGLVQMIPSTYAIVRNRFYNVGLIPDFVDGMRNHLNAVKAMLLYMKMVWEDLLMNDVVYQALQSGIATQKELIAAGYNSNPARLPLYIQRGGANWRELIPAETKIYLEIYRSMELFVPLEPRKE